MTEATTTAMLRLSATAATAAAAQTGMPLLPPWCPPPPLPRFHLSSSEHRFKIKVKLPPRQPSGDGASVAGGGMAATDANANAAASLKRPADGPPADVGGAAAPPQKLKITLK